VGENLLVIRNQILNDCVMVIDFGTQTILRDETLG
jgi:hypothetical protein